MQPFALKILLSMGVLLVAVTNGLATAAAEPQVLGFEVSETAGIRRRNDIVSARFQFSSPLPSNTRFRVLQAGEPVAGQIRPLVDGSRSVREVAVDFVANMAPLEVRRYHLEYGPDVPATDEPAAGLELVETDDEFRISNRSIVWRVRKDLRGLFRFHAAPDRDFVEADSTGLTYRVKRGDAHRLSDTAPSAVRVTRQGPLACALEFVYDDLPFAGSSRVALEFVRTKSWVRVTWSIDSSDVSALEAELHLQLTGREKLIDFGGNDFVYTTVTEGQVAALDARPAEGDRAASWQVLRGPAGKLESQVVGTIAQPGVGGWAHVMDDSRCTAIAIADFARHARDRIQVDSQGRTRIHRDVSVSAGDSKQRRPKLEFWAHFVGVPVHIGARTSPQSMRSPLQVR